MKNAPLPGALERAILNRMREMADEEGLSQTEPVAEAARHDAKGFANTSQAAAMRAFEWLKSAGYIERVKRRGWRIKEEIE